MKNIHVPNTGVLSGIDLVTEVNDGFDSLQTNIAGVLNKNVTGLSSITLSNDESYYGIIEFNGTLTANINVIVPASEMKWTVYNNTSGSYSITLKTALGSGGIVPQGIVTNVICNGENVYLATASNVVSTYTVASASSITPNAETTSQFNITALNQTTTIQKPSGSFSDGKKLTIRIRDNGTDRSLTWITAIGGYRAVGVTLPTTTKAGKVTYVGCIYNAQDNFWDVIAVSTQT